jgi:hypothetical protein
MSFREEGAPDSNPVLASLYFQLGDTSVGDQLDQLANFLDCHNGIA